MKTLKEVIKNKALLASCILTIKKNIVNEDYLTIFI